MIVTVDIPTHETSAVRKMDEMKRQVCEPQPYHCCSEFHLAALAPICALIYSFAIRLSKKSKTFSASAISVAKFFRYNESTIRRGFKGLENLGFFEKTIQGTFNPSVYRVLTHEQWSAKHPNQCVTKLEFHWAHENDPLGQELYFATGGQVKWKPFQIELLRELRLSDEQVKDEFVNYYAQEGQRKKAANVPPGFIHSLRENLKGTLAVVHAL